MTMELSKRARSAAGAFLLLMLMVVAGLGVWPASMSAAERIRFALAREGQACPTAADGTVWGLAPLPNAATPAERSALFAASRTVGANSGSVAA